jgi:hypothetical protein
MEQKVIGILKNISELLVAILVEENDTAIKIKAPAFLGISGQNNQVNINFIPIEMLSIQPAVNIRNLLQNPQEDIIYTFEKSSLLKYDLQLAENVISNYLNLVNSVNTNNNTKQSDQSVKPEDNIIKLF